MSLGVLQLLWKDKNLVMSALRVSCGLHPASLYTMCGFLFFGPPVFFSTSSRTRNGASATKISQNGSSETAFLGKNDETIRLICPSFLQWFARFCAVYILQLWLCAEGTPESYGFLLQSACCVLSTLFNFLHLWVWHLRWMAFFVSRLDFQFNRPETGGAVSVKVIRIRKEPESFPVFARFSGLFSKIFQLDRKMVCRSFRTQRVTHTHNPALVFPILPKSCFSLCFHFLHTWATCTDRAKRAQLLGRR